MSAAIPVADMCSSAVGGPLPSPPMPLLRTRQQVAHAPTPPHRDDRGRLRPASAERTMAPWRKHSRGQRGSGSPATRLQPARRPSCSPADSNN